MEEDTAVRVLSAEEHANILAELARSEDMCELLLQKVSLLEDEARERETRLQEVQQEVDDYEKEMRGVRDQAITVRRLERERDEALAQLRERSDATSSERVAELTDLLERSKEDLHMVETQLGSEVAHWKAAADREVQEHEGAKRKVFSLMAELDRMHHAKDSGDDLVRSEMERLGHEVNRLREENGFLKRKVETADESAALYGGGRERSDMPSVGARSSGGSSRTQATIAHLKEELEHTRVLLQSRDNALQSEKERSLTAVAALESDLRLCEGKLRQSKAALAEAIDDLEDRPSPEVVESLLQFLFNVEKRVSEGPLIAPLDSFEEVAVSRRIEEVEQHLTCHWDEVAKRQTRLLERIRQLEIDSKKPEPLPPSSREKQVDVATVLSSSSLASSPLATSGNDHSASSPTAPHQPSVEEILKSQRDTLKKRLAGVEQTVSELRRRATDAETMAASLRNDNLTLYGQLQYLRDEQQGEPFAIAADRPPTSGISAGSSRQNGSRPTTIGSGVTVERKYATEYAAHVNPFDTFREKQNEAALRKMAPPERAVFHIGKLLFSKSHFRHFAVLYVLLLHILVVFALFHEMGSHCDAPSNLSVPHAPGHGPLQ